MRNGWEIKKLGEVCDIINGKNQSNVLSKNGKFPIYGSAGNLMGYATEFICEKGTTIIGRKGNISNPIFINERFWNVDTAFGLFPKNGYDPKFIHYLCQTIDFKSRNRGTTIPSLVKSDLLNIDVPFNKSFSEQQRIVAILDEALAAIIKAKANAEQNLKNATELFENYLQSVFVNKSGEWASLELIRICEEITDGSHYSPKSSGNGEYPYITVRDIENDIIDFDSCKFISSDDYKALLRNGCKPNVGDLLFSKDGTVGKVSLVDFEKDFVVLSSLAIIRPKRNIIEPSFLKYVLKNPTFLEAAIGMKTGVAIRRIILKNLKQINVGFPKSLNEQNIIVKRLDLLKAEIQKLESIYQQKINSLEELKKSVLQKAFSGELTTEKAVAV
jgi:type I restriction enzyme, S subunit